MKYRVKKLTYHHGDFYQPQYRSWYTLWTWCPVSHPEAGMEITEYAAWEMCKRHQLALKGPIVTYLYEDKNAVQP